MAGILTNERYSLYFQKVGLLYKRPEIRASLEIILSVFTITILIYAAIRPTLTNIATLRKKIEDQEVISKKADNKIAQLYAAQEQLDSLAGSLGLFDEAVPDIFSYADSAKRIEYLAKKNNLTIDSLSFSGMTLQGGGKIGAGWGAKLAKPTTNNILPDLVSFSVNGKPSDVVSFLGEVENMDRLAGLNHVSLSKQTSMNKSGDTLRASGQITFYFYSEKQ